MAKSYSLEVITPEELFYKGDAEQIIIRTLEGDEGFLADHAPAVKLLADGELWIKEKDGSDFKIANVSGGFVDVRKNIIIYTDSANWISANESKRRKQ